MNFSESNGIFKIIILKRALFIWKAWITYLKFILLMQTIFLKIDFYWWTKLLLMFKFKDSMARAHALLWGPQQFRSAQQCLSHSPWHKVWTYRLWLQNLVCFVNDFHLLSERFLRFFFFFQLSLPESQLTCLNCPGGCRCCLPVLNSAVTFEVVSWCVNEQGSL